MGGGVTWYEKLLLGWVVGWTGMEGFTGVGVGVDKLGGVVTRVVGGGWPYTGAYSIGECHGGRWWGGLA